MAMTCGIIDVKTVTMRDRGYLKEESSMIKYASNALFKHACYGLYFFIG